MARIAEHAEIELTDPSHQKLVDDLLSKDKFLDAAEVIRTNISAAEYSAVIKEKFITLGYTPSVSHEHVVRTLPKIFVTTNYDTIMESTLTKVAGIDSFTQFEHATNGLNDSI
ncbi:hypothetical protein HGB07_09945, partial [Candidatus Roizmanbacteria bacterium]|nr:hypothetical protein [Candidatus Roizmanbacteria bacterium]